MWKKICLSLLLIISAIGGFFVAKAQITLDDSLSNVKRDYNNVLSKVDLNGIRVTSDKDVINILVIGNDYRKEKYYNASGLTDTMIIATMDLKHGVLKTASLMRDCYVQIPGHGYGKLNAANSYGGVKLLYKTIAQNFNIQLDGYVEIGFSAFQEVVDAVGGVNVELTQSEASYLNSTNYIRNKKYRNVKVGKQTLNGSQALGYCRIRKRGVTINGLRDDYGRTWRQRTVINAVFKKVKSLPMTDWVKIANKVLKNITTDLSNDKILEYLKDVVMMGTTQIHQLQIPINGYFRGSNRGEFSVGSCIVLTDGVNTASNPRANAEALKRFLFEYDGVGNFKYGKFVANSK